MPELIVNLNISAEQMAGYYRGQVRTVVARATNGQTVQFPASALQRHVALDGVHGRFRIVFDEQRKFLGFEPIGGVDPST